MWKKILLPNIYTITLIKSYNDIVFLWEYQHSKYFANKVCVNYVNETFIAISSFFIAILHVPIYTNS